MNPIAAWRRLRGPIGHYLHDLGGWFWAAMGSSTIGAVGLLLNGLGVSEFPPWLLGFLLGLGLLVAPFVPYYRLLLRLQTANATIEEHSKGRDRAEFCRQLKRMLSHALDDFEPAMRTSPTAIHWGVKAIALAVYGVGNRDSQAKLVTAIGELVRTKGDPLEGIKAGIMFSGAIASLTQDDVDATRLARISHQY